MERYKFHSVVPLSMLEVLFLVAIVLLVILLIFGFSLHREKKLAEDIEREIVSAKDRIKIAERKFMQGKIKKSVFDLILDDLEGELLSAEMALFRIKRSSEVSIGDKALMILSKIDKPTKHRKAGIEKLLKETELLRVEMSMLEGKLLKREINQSVFEKLIKEKESQMIQKEKDLMDIVASAKNEVFMDAKPYREKRKEHKN